MVWFSGSQSKLLKSNSTISVDWYPTKRIKCQRTIQNDIFKTFYVMMEFMCVFIKWQNVPTWPKKLLSTTYRHVTDQKTFLIQLILFRSCKNQTSRRATYFSSCCKQLIAWVQCVNFYLFIISICNQSNGF